MESLAFSLFSGPVQDKFNELCEHPGELFLVDISSFQVWDEYLNAYPVEVNGVFRERRHYDCNCCKNFVRRIGSVVRVVDNKIVDTIWNVSVPGYYQEVAKTLHEIVSKAKLQRAFVISETTAGSLPTVDNYNSNIIWDHFYVKIPQNYILNSDNFSAVVGDIDTTISVFKRAMNELTLPAAEIVLDLINANQIYRGQEYKHFVEYFIERKKEYDALPEELKDNYVLVKGSKASERSLLRLKNTAIGTLLDDLSKDMELEAAVRSFESKVDSTNYRRTTAVVSPAMIKKAQQAISELGYENSLYRKMMSPSELDSENVLWTSTPNKALNVFDDITMSQEQRIVREKTKNVKAKPLSIEELLNNVLPEAKECSVLFDSRLKNHLMTLTNVIDPSSKPMFKWDNNIAWSYNGDVTDRIKERVKEAGGDVEGDLRVSLSWSNSDDLDLHCFAEGGLEINFANKKKIPGLFLDLDMNGMDKHDSEHPVENIICKDKRSLKPGRYVFIVNQFSCRNKNKHGFTIQVEFDGIIHSFSYEEFLRNKEKFRCFEIVFDGSDFKIEHVNDKFTETTDISTSEIWGLQTNTFVPVSSVLLSPNYWNQNAIGNKHFLFLVENAFNPEKVRTFYSEYLNAELYEHRKTMELLGASETLKAEPTSEQLSGFGFSESSQSELIIRVVNNKNITTLYKLSI